MLFLGVDGGGSHTRALICDESGQLLGRGQSGPCNPMATSADECRTHIQKAVESAVSEAGSGLITAAHLGIAGTSNQKGLGIVQEIAAQLFDPSATKLSISHDLEIALEGGLIGAPGIALIAGTGSACYGKDDSGEATLVGGWGDGVDDAGSASWIGLQALQCLVRQTDGRLPEDSLRSGILDYLNIKSMDAFKERYHMSGFGRSDRAAIAPLVFQLAELGTPSALKIRDEAADELSKLVEVCIRKTKLESPQILTYGGLFHNSKFKQLVSERIATHNPDATAIEPELSPVSGALLLAMKSSGLPTSGLTLEKSDLADY